LLNQLDIPITKGLIYNSMKFKAGFINRLSIAKEELKAIEA
jgi:hypothetical protein